MKFSRLGIKTQAQVALHVYQNDTKKLKVIAAEILEKFGLEISLTHVSNIKWNEVVWAKPLYRAFHGTNYATLRSEAVLARIAELSLNHHALIHLKEHGIVKSVNELTEQELDVFLTRI